MAVYLFPINNQCHIAEFLLVQNLNEISFGYPLLLLLNIEWFTLSGSTFFGYRWQSCNRVISTDKTAVINGVTSSQKIVPIIWNKCYFINEVLNTVAVLTVSASFLICLTWFSVDFFCIISRLQIKQTLVFNLKIRIPGTKRKILVIQLILQIILVVVGINQIYDN